MLNNFNYHSYKRFNGPPHYHHREKRNNIPLNDSSSDGHRSRDSHLSFTTSDDDGIFSDSDNGLNVGGAPVEGNYILTRQVDKNNDIHHRVKHFEYDSISNEDDGFTDSIYRFSNSTSDRGEITNPDTDSALSSDAPDVFFKEALHGEHGSGHIKHDHSSGIPDAFDYTPLHNALWTLDRRIGNKGGVDDYIYYRDDFEPFYGDRWAHMAFSDNWEDCVDCIPGHPDHFHHVLDHPDMHGHTHDPDAVDDKGWPLPKATHNHDKPEKPTPPAENLQNAYIARDYLHFPEPWLTTEEVPDVTPHPTHFHHVLDHDSDQDHFHDYLLRNLNLAKDEEPHSEPDHTHDKKEKQTPPPESR